MTLDLKTTTRNLAIRKRSAPVKFTEKQQKAIKKKYDHRCALCCLGVKDGIDILVVHKRASFEGGKATIENGQVLCTEHNEIRYNADANHTKIYTSLMLKMEKHKKDKRKNKHQNKHQNKHMEKFYHQLLKIFSQYKTI